MKIFIHFPLIVTGTFLIVFVSLVQTQYKKNFLNTIPQRPNSAPLPTLNVYYFYGGGRGTELARNTFDLRYREHGNRVSRWNNCVLDHSPGNLHFT